MGTGPLHVCVESDRATPAQSTDHGDAWAADLPGHNAPGERPAAAKVEVEVMVVHATNAHSRVDARLKPLLPHLRHLNYSGYSVLDVRSDDLGPGQETSFSIVGGRRLQIQLIEKDDRRARIRVRMFNSSGRVLDTTVSIHRDRSFIVAGPHHEDGVLILPLTARY